MVRALLTLTIAWGLVVGCQKSPPEAEAAPGVDAAKPAAQGARQEADPLAGIEQQLGLDEKPGAPAEPAGPDEIARPAFGTDGLKPPAGADNPLPNPEASAEKPAFGPGSVEPGDDPLVGYRGKRHVVDANGGGDFLNIAAALASASANDVIAVRPGTYREPLKLTRPVAIVGDGPREEVQIEVTGANVVQSTAVRALLKGLTLRQAGGEPKRYGVDVRDGRLEVRECDVQSATLAALAVRDKGQLVIVESRLHDSRESAVFAYEGGRVEVTACDITGNGAAGVEVKGTGQGTIRNSRIHDGGASGVFVHAGGRATVERNRITRNRLAGIEVKSGGRATIRENRVVDGEQSGIFVNQGGGGTIEDNIVRGNGLAGMEIKSGADPVVRGNTFEGGRQSGIFVNEGALGTLENNTVRGNALAGIEIKGGTPVVRGNTVEENVQSGIYVHGGGGGTLEGNTVRRNGKAGFEINRGARPTVIGNTIQGNSYQGIWILPEGGGSFRGNTFSGNSRGPVRVDGDAAGQVRGDLDIPPPVDTPIEPAAPKKDPAPRAPGPHDEKVGPPKW